MLDLLSSRGMGATVDTSDWDIWDYLQANDAYECVRGGGTVRQTANGQVCINSQTTAKQIPVWVWAVAFGVVALALVAKR